MHTQFATLSEARSHMTDLTDAAISGRPAGYARDGLRVAAVDAERLRDALSRLHPARADTTPRHRASRLGPPGWLQASASRPSNPGPAQDAG